ncbi:protein kinase family protein [Acetobacter conturbans]|uniref:Protein kinase domain-containing protein n=1 Tax=Acetobacter conturbans TaxID=1737472 RepID=A0ABX0K3H9_9PROT|nr:hypothetical protein [Acetobacter conturbans]NHN88878.1 hypothetical protein [Acetobacter conturbans]
MAEGEEFGQSETTDSQAITIDGRYVINLAQRLPDFANVPAYGARDSMSPTTEMLALAPETFVPARANAASFIQIRSPYLLPVRSVSDVSGSVWILCDSPPGIPLTETSGWTEASVIDRVIVPLANVLHTYHEAGLTHRAIRPDNVFDPGGKSPACLGPALASPPAYYQPDRFEPLTSAICPPAARGNGSIADDVFSLGALAVWLLGGCEPYQKEASGVHLEDRIQKGSFAVLASQLSLSPDVLQLLAAMLSDNPTLRPTPRDLLNAAGHKGFVVRQSPVATAALLLGSARIRTGRALAWYAVHHRQEFVGLFVRGVVERWLSYELGLTQATSRLSQLPKDAALGESGNPASAAVFMEIIATIDPTMPLFWNGMWLWPDAMGQILTTYMSGSSGFPTDPTPIAFDLLRSGKIEKFAQITAIPGQAAACRLAQKAVHQVDVSKPTDVVRLPYILNPLQACLSPRCVSRRFSVPLALLQWLNTNPESAQGANATALLDIHMTSFLVMSAVRNRLIDHFTDLMIARNTWFLDLLLLAKLQHLYMTGMLAGIGRKLLPHLSPELKKWRSRSSRTERGERLATAATVGDLGLMYELLHDVQGLKQDQLAWSAAQQQTAQLENERTQLQHAKLELQPAVQNEMISLATAVGVVCAIGSLCAEMVF